MYSKKYHRRIRSYDFVRTIACAGVFLFHLDRAAAAYFPYAAVQHLPEWSGFLFVTVFFVLSGSVIQLQYGISREQQIQRVKQGSLLGQDGFAGHRQKQEAWDIPNYYKKRWAGIFPAFYAVFFPLWLLAAFRRGTLFFRGNPWSILLSVAGLDGYFSASTSTYYMVGEWFLGALILVYAIYPVLKNLMEHASFLLLGGSLLLFLLTADMQMLAVSPLANFPSCVISFVCGMYFERLVRADRRRRGSLFLFSLGILMICAGLRRNGAPVSLSVFYHLAGLLLFLILYELGECLFSMKTTRESRVSLTFTTGIRSFSAITFEFYLVHHKLIEKGMEYCAEHDPSAVLKAYVVTGLGAFLGSLVIAIVLHKGSVLWRRE